MKHTRLYISGLLLLILGLLVTVALADTQKELMEFEPNVTISGDTPVAVYHHNIAAQTFTATTSYEISMLRIYGYITQSDPEHPKYVDVQLQTGNGTVVATTRPTNHIAYHSLFGDKSATTMSFNYFTTDGNGSWIDCQLQHSFRTTEGEMYAVVVKNPSGDADNVYNWYEDDTGDPYSGGAACTSDDGGATWTVDTDADLMFGVYGDAGLLIQSVNAYKDFYEDGDWLIVTSYLNKAAPYYKSDDIEQYFRLKLVDNTTGDVAGETVLRSWDAAVASIYLNPDEVSGLEWETGDFTLTIQPTYTSWHVDYNMVPANFIGSTLTFLDKWCIAQAQWMGVQNKDNDMYYLEQSTVGLVINEKGIQLFDLGIPRLGQVRGSYIYKTYMNPASLKPIGTPNPALQSRFVWETQIGTQLAGLLDDIADPFHLEGKTLGIVLFACMYVMVVGVSFPAGHSTAGSIIGFIVILAGMIAGALDVVWIILAGVFMLIMVLRQLILVST